ERPSQRPQPSPFFSTLPPSPPSTLLPYTTLFRSDGHSQGGLPGAHGRRADGRGAHDPRHPQGSAGRPRVRDGQGVLEQLRRVPRSEEHTSELQSRENLVCRLLLEKKKKLNRVFQC